MKLSRACINIAGGITCISASCTIAMITTNCANWPKTHIDGPRSIYMHEIDNKTLHYDFKDTRNKSVDPSILVWTCSNPDDTHFNITIKNGILNIVSLLGTPENNYQFNIAVTNVITNKIVKNSITLSIDNVYISISNPLPSISIGVDATDANFNDRCSLYSGSSEIFSNKWRISSLSDKIAFDYLEITNQGFLQRNHKPLTDMNVGLYTIYITTQYQNSDPVIGELQIHIYSKPVGINITPDPASIFEFLDICCFVGDYADGSKLTSWFIAHVTDNDGHYNNVDQSVRWNIEQYEGEPCPNNDQVEIVINSTLNSVYLLLHYDNLYVQGSGVFTDWVFCLSATSIIDSSLIAKQTINVFALE